MAALTRRAGAAEKGLGLLAALVLLVFSAGPLRASFRETPVVRAVRLAGPAVVNISTQQVVRGRSPFRSFQGGDLFEWFFRDFFEPSGRGEMTRTSLGSGVIIDGQAGYILTNEHVVVQASEIKVSLVDELEYTGSLVGSDPDSDLAVLKIEAAKELPALAMGSSSDLMIGETVVAIGNPFGLTHTVTTGVISALGRSVRKDNRVYRDFIQTDASINPGNSGGPLLNINGDLIGINTAVYAGAEGIGFAIPINKAKRILQDLIAYGEVHPAWLGLSVQSLTPRLAQHLGLPNHQGAIITEVDPQGPAADSGLRRGDVIVGLDRHRVASADTYEDILKTYTARDELTLKVYRQGHELSLTVQAREFSLDKAMELSLKRYGLYVSGPSQGGVVIARVRPGSPAEGIGLEPGDIIHQVNEVKTAQVEDYLKAMAKYRLRRGVSMTVQRGRVLYHLTLTR